MNIRKYVKIVAVGIAFVCLTSMGCIWTIGNVLKAWSTIDKSSQHSLKVSDKDYMEKLLSGQVKAINEDKDLDVNNINVHDAKTGKALYEINKTQNSSINMLTTEMSEALPEFELVDQNKVVDNRKISDDGNVENYSMNVAIENTFIINEKNEVSEGDIIPVLTDSKQDTEVNVTVGAKIDYAKISVSGGTAYKIIKVYGKYIKTTDSQMVCSSLKQKSKGFDAYYYDSSGKKYTNSSGKNTDDTGKTSIKQSPSLGTWYSVSTGQKHFWKTEPGYNVTNVFFTVERRVSSFSREYYIRLGFGNVDKL